MTEMEGKMQIVMIILSFALLIWVEAASAQTAPTAQTKTYSVSVSQHSELSQKLTVEDVNKILADASKMLQKPGHVSSDDNTQCDVTFTLKGTVAEFSGVPKIVNRDVNNLDIDAVHRVPDPNGADVHIKVVEKILNFCRFRDPSPKQLGVNGCSFPPNFRSIVVVHPATHTDPDRADPSRDRADPTRDVPAGTFPDHILWVHEFGHLTGLGHEDRRISGTRDLEPFLMTRCNLKKIFPQVPVPDAQVKVSERECTCFRLGPGFGPNGICPLPGVDPNSSLAFGLPDCPQ